ncbi:MAG: HEAT repeat domain-containing protein [Planctomycetota bacterium]
MSTDPRRPFRCLPRVGMAAVSVVFLVAPLAAHGGGYVPPGSRRPPVVGKGETPRPTGPGYPVGPSGPSRPGPATPPAGPGTPAPAVPGGPGPGGPITGGIELPPDDTVWENWWEFNKAPFLALRASLGANAPLSEDDEFFLGSGTKRIDGRADRVTQDDLSTRLVPALYAVLIASEQKDLQTACMIALAKSGVDAPGIDVLAALKSRLAEHDQEVRETAALALGISQRRDALPLVLDLARDSEAGRKAAGRDHVDDRTRTFAIYALGLIAWGNQDNPTKTAVLQAAREILVDRADPNYDLRVAAVHAIGLLRPDCSTAYGRNLLSEAVRILDDAWQGDVDYGERTVQAHVPTEIARLFQGVDLAAHADLAKRLDQCRASWLAELLAERGQRRDPRRAESAAIALGRVTRAVGPTDTEPQLDVKIVGALIDAASDASDVMVRRFATMSLGFIGGARARDELLTTLRRGSKSLERPWAALALGVLAFRERVRLGADAPFDDLIGRGLADQLELVNPSALAAVAIGLGLAHHTPSTAALRELLQKHRSKDELAGHLCVALALLDDRESIAAIQEIARQSTRRSVRLRQAAVALGKLGDASATRTLIDLLDVGEPDLARTAAVASALGLIGGRPAIDPLIALLVDTRATSLTRAFAAVALGGVGDKELLPWNSKIGFCTNYFAPVETLSNQQTGILDIL